MQFKVFIQKSIIFKEHQGFHFLVHYFCILDIQVCVLYWKSPFLLLTVFQKDFPKGPQCTADETLSSKTLSLTDIVYLGLTQSFAQLQLKVILPFSTFRII